MLIEGLIWLVEELLDHLCDGFSLFIGGLLGGVYFRDKPTLMMFERWAPSGPNLGSSFHFAEIRRGES